MNITVKAGEPKDNKLIAEVAVVAKDVDAAIKKAYKDIANKYNFQGFRKGRTPRPVIDSAIGREAVLAQATNEILNEVEPLVVEELDVVPMGEPSFGEEPKLAEEGTDYVFEVTIPVRPEVELDSYDAPTIQMPPEEVTEAEVDQQVELLQSYQASFEDVEDAERAVVKGDIVQVDLDNVEGAEEWAGKNRLATLDGFGMPQEIQDAIVGLKKGESKDVEWTETHEHGDHVHEVVHKLKVTLNTIKERVIPELTDEVVKKGFGFETVAELRDAIKEEIEQDKRLNLPNMKQDRVVEAISEHLTIDEVPEEYVNQVFNETAQQILGNLQQQGMSLDGYLGARGIKPEDFIADLRKQAEERARQSLALDALAKHLNLEATVEEVKEEFAKAGAEVESLYEQFKKAGNLPAVRESIRRTKALNWLTENVKVNIVDEIAEKRAAEAAEAPVEEPAAEEPKDIEAEVDAIMAEVHEAADAPAEETSEE
ncbi:MAG: trigger factor [Atopobiaceae bacterium]|nr:trigger factor [Atopobiaceae bacterium]